jgi:hypothetical protein
MKKVFGLMMVLALAGLVSCGEAVVETPAETTTVEVEAPVVNVETPVAEDVVVDETMVDAETPVVDETAPVETETPVVDETLTPSAE